MPRYRPGLCLGGAPVLGLGEFPAGRRQDSSASSCPVFLRHCTEPHDSILAPTSSPQCSLCKDGTKRGMQKCRSVSRPPQLWSHQRRQRPSLFPKYRSTAEHALEAEDGPRQVRSETVRGNGWWPIKSKVTRHMDMASAYRFTSWIRWSWFWGFKEAVSLNSPRRQRKCYFYCFWHGILLEQKLAASLENICSSSRSQRQIHFLLRGMDHAPQRLGSKWDLSFSTYKNEHLLKF